jgi:hypothetical protein
LKNIITILLSFFFLAECYSQYYGAAISSSQPYDIEYLVVGGGGGSGNGATYWCGEPCYARGGGGGGGGYRAGTKTEVALDVSLTITVGSGGAASVKGDDSVFDDITATGGGGGGHASSTNGGNGDSGGSGGGYGEGGTGNGTEGNGNTPSTSPSQGGNAKGTMGGGAGGNAPDFGNVGPAYSSSITGTADDYGLGGDGDTFGGQRSGIAGEDGVGEGAGCATGATYNGAAGGDGVVILRMLTADYSGTTTGSPTVTTDGSYTVLKYLSSGTYTP